MNLFKRKEPTLQQVIEKAENLILNQLSDDHTSWLGRVGPCPAPAAEYAEGLIKEQMKNEKVRDSISELFQNKALDSIIKTHIRETINEILKEDLIKGIVKEINASQLNMKEG